MKPPGTQIRPEGLNIIILAVLFTLVTAMLDCPLGALLGIILTGFALNFFRDPERVVPDEPDAAVSPADGKIVRTSYMDDPFTGEKRRTVCVFMNVFNVHVNRMPVSGRVEKISYFPGRFINASLDKASTHNERCVWLLRDEQDRTWTMVQIAGLVARRIVPLAEKGDTFSRGDRYGLIKFGSRVDLYLPKGYEPVVNQGDKVKAGESILARKTANTNEHDQGTQT